MICQPSALNPQPSIRLHIERLVLDGLPMDGRSATQVRAAVEAELARQLNDGGLAAALQSGVTLASSAGGSITVTGHGGAAILGRQIGQAIYAGIGGNPPRQWNNSTRPHKSRKTHP